MKPQPSLPDPRREPEDPTWWLFVVIQTPLVALLSYALINLAAAIGWT